jgi:uncharacterized protein YpmS
MPNKFSKSDAYLAPNYTSNTVITLTLTSTSLGGLPVTEAHISSFPNFTSYDTVTITTSPQNANFTLANPSIDGLKYVYVR